MKDLFETLVAFGVVGFIVLVLYILVRRYQSRPTSDRSAWMKFCDEIKKVMKNKKEE